MSLIAGKTKPNGGGGVHQYEDSEIYVTDLNPLPIDGLEYYENFLSPEEEEKILAICDSNPWLKIIKRRQQFYGTVYYHTTHQDAELQPSDHPTPSLSINQFDWLKEKIESLEWKDKIFGNESFPTQILVNEYEGMTGISSHFEDENSFGDIIATISLISPILMSLQCPKEHNNDCQDLIASTKILLEPRSLLILAKDARYKWRHGIARAAKHVHLKDGTSIKRDDPNKLYRRISLTIRHLRDTRRKVNEMDLGLTSIQIGINRCQQYIDEISIYYNLTEDQKIRMIQLLSPYENSNRSYHTWCHLADMFTLLDSYRAFITDRSVIILSILFHDVIYDVKSSTNEEDSAELFLSFVKFCGTNSNLNKIKNLVYNYIIATKTHQVGDSNDRDLQFFIDFDMAVLSWPRERYLRYAGQIRDEYIHIPRYIYIEKRREFLLNTAQSGKCTYATTEFQEYESRAIENMLLEAEELSKGQLPYH